MDLDKDCKMETIQESKVDLTQDSKVDLIRTVKQDLIEAGDVIIIQRQSYMKTHKLNSSDKKASLVQLGKLTNFSFFQQILVRHGRVYILGWF